MPAAGGGIAAVKKLQNPSPAKLDESAQAVGVFSVGDALLRWPALSPDGATLVFAAEGDLWSVKLSEAAPGVEPALARRLTAHGGGGTGAVCCAPVFSPDGARLAYAVAHEEYEEVRVLLLLLLLVLQLLMVLLLVLLLLLSRCQAARAAAGAASCCSCSCC